MRITKFSISNYRSCLSTSFEPHPNLSVLVGPNGSGKTNVMSGLRLLQGIASGARRPRAQENVGTSVTDLRTRFELDDGTATHFVRLHLVAGPQNREEITGERDSWYLPDYSKSKERLALPSHFFAELGNSLRHAYYFGSQSRRVDVLTYLVERGIKAEAVGAIRKIVNFEAKINYYGASQFTNPANCPLAFEVELESNRSIPTSTLGHRKFLYDMFQASRQNAPGYATFADLIGKGGIGLVDKISFKTVRTSTSNVDVSVGGKIRKRRKENQLIIPQFKIGSNLLSPTQLSEGTFKSLALIFYLVTDTSSVLMIEEPEVCVHLGLLTSILELINRYSKNKQIIVSTHSDAVVDRVGVENLYRVENERGRGTQIARVKSQLKGKDLVALRDYLANVGSLGEYWRQGGLESNG